MRTIRLMWLGLGGLTGALLMSPTPGTGAAPPPRARIGPQPAPGMPADWQARVQRDLAAREYEITWQAQPVIDGLDASWHAPNRAHGFRTYFTPEGIRVVPRTGEETSWTWGLSLIGVGRGGDLWPLGEARLSPVGSRIDYYRDQAEEWYENSPARLKHGFVLKAAPTPGLGRDRDPRDLVHLDLALWGDLSPLIAAGGQVIDFVTARGARAVRYAGLAVTDAQGQRLPAWMEGMAGERGRGIRIVVDDRGTSVLPHHRSSRHQPLLDGRGQSGGRPLRRLRREDGSIGGSRNRFAEGRAVMQTHGREA